MKTTLDDLLATPTGQKMLEEHRAANEISEEDRMAAAEELAELRQSDAEADRLQQERREAEARLEELEEERKTAKADLTALGNQLAGLAARRERRERDLLRVLRDSAPPELRQLRDWARAEEAVEVVRDVKTKERRLLGGRTTPTHWTKPSIERRLAYLRSITAPGGLADQALELGDVHDVRVRCAEIQAGLGDIPVKFEKIRR